MDLFANERSLHGQFQDRQSFLIALKQMLRCKDMADRYNVPLYCMRSITQQHAMPSVSFKDAVGGIGDRNSINKVKLWVSIRGPFWDDSRQHDPREYFAYGDEDDIVTDCSLGETAFRCACNQQSAVVSFTPSKFVPIDPLIVYWHHSNTQHDKLEIRNFWEPNDLSHYLQNSRTPPQSWKTFMAYVQTDFAYLTFLDTLMSTLQNVPFNATVASHIVERLNVLNTLKTCFDAQGKLTSDGHAIMQNHFHGATAWFSDESATNKRDFKNELTFKKPDGGELFCPYHGKIRGELQFRIHFSWPIQHDEPLYIAYIGPKITKK